MSIHSDFRQYSGNIEEFQEWLEELKREYRRQEACEAYEIMREEAEYELVSDCDESSDYDY